VWAWGVGAAAGVAWGAAAVEAAAAAGVLWGAGRALWGWGAEPGAALAPWCWARAATATTLPLACCSWTARAARVGDRLSR